MLRSLFVGIVGAVTLLSGLFFFRSEAQFWLERRHLIAQNKIQPPTGTPWLSAQRWDQYSAVALYHQPSVAAIGYEHALRQDAANLTFWNALSYAYFYSGDNDSADVAVGNSLRAPLPRMDIAMAQALLAADFWSNAAQHTQHLWADNLSFLMSQVPRELAKRAVAANRDTRLCQIISDNAPLSSFCAKTIHNRQVCAGITPGQKNAHTVCQEWGYPTKGTPP